MRRLRPVLVAIAALSLWLSAACAQAAVHVSGLVESATWTASGSPYVLTGDLEVASSAVITVAPGTVIEGGGHDMEVYGDLEVRGTGSEPVVLRDVNLRGRGSFAVPSTIDTFTITIEHADIDGGSLQGGGYTMYGSWAIRDSLISNISEATYLWYPRSRCVVERNVFINAGGLSAGLYYADLDVLANVFYRSDPSSALISDWAAYGDASFRMRDNSFLNPGAPTVEIPEWTDSGRVDATGNDWGTTDEEAIASMIFDRNDTLASPGFVAVGSPLASRAASAPADTLPLTSQAGLTPALSVPAYGRAATLSAKLTDARSAPVAGQPVRLERLDGGTWTVVGSGRTDSVGAATFSATTSSARLYRVVFDGVPGVYSDAVSPQVKIQPKAQLTTPRAPTTVQRGEAFSISGYLKPRHTRGARSAQLRFYRYQRTSTGAYGWVFKKSTMAKNANYSTYTRYSARTSISTAGRWRVRARHADTGHSASYSAWRNIRVR